MTFAPESNMQYLSSPDVGAVNAPTLMAETEGPAISGSTDTNSPVCSIRALLLRVPVEE